MKRCLAITVLALTAGCSSGTFNAPVTKVSKEEMMAATARRGYHEIAREKLIYVVATPDAIERVNAGKEPVSKVAAIGFGPHGALVRGAHRELRVVRRVGDRRERPGPQHAQGGDGPGDAVQLVLVQPT